ncbi:MAG: hypothetical protein PVH21_06080, partial [Myxococcales bacterium]
FVYVFSLGAMLLVGCGDSEGTGGSGGEAGTGGTNLTAVTVQANHWEVGGYVGPLEDVELCQVGTDYCVMSDSEGWATLQLPAGEEVAFTVEKEGFIKYLSAGVIPEAPLQFQFGMATNERGALVHELVMSPYPPEGTGDIVISCFGGVSLPGATLELVGATGKGFYYDEEGYWDPDLTETTSRPGSGSLGGFTEVAPGVVEVTWGGTAEGVPIFKGWPSEKENTMRVPVMAGYMSLEDLLCPAE